MSTLRDKLPTDEVMRQLSKIAVENATASLATKAREFARILPPGITGAQALEAFASSIDSTNAKQFGKGRGQ